MTKAHKILTDAINNNPKKPELVINEVIVGILSRIDDLEDYLETINSKLDEIGGKI